MEVPIYTKLEHIFLKSQELMLHFIEHFFLESI